MTGEGTVADCSRYKPRKFRKLSGNFFFADVMAHEMAHMRNHFHHSRRFAAKNKKHMVTIVNWFISGQYYLDKEAANKAEEVKMNGT